MSMKMGKSTVYWHKNQVSLHFQLPVSAAAAKDEIKSSVQTRLDDLNQQVLKDVATLSFIQKSNVPHAGFQNAAGVEQGMNEPDGLEGVYLFPLPPKPVPPHRPGPPSGGPVDNSDVIGFFQIDPGPASITGTMQDKETMKGDSGTSGMSSEDMQDQTLAIVSLLLQRGQPAMPHWLWSCTQDVPTHGCPVIPPIPVADSGNIGQWKLSFPNLSSPFLENKSGEGVTVFVLDTLPHPDQILASAKRAGGSNMLLQDMVEKTEQVKFCYQPLSEILDVPNPEQPVTGKDIFGNLVGFPMADHGLFIAGIIHNLAPSAKIECIRVLNDFGVGDTNALIGALKYILQRISKNPVTNQPGDLYQQPVVINLSLVVMPPENDHSVDVPADIAKSTRDILFELMQELANNGAVLVASAGNDSDPRDTDMNPSKIRYMPRYPAYFAYTDPALAAIIPVGAVNQSGEPASYSNQPGPNGIATYGGELPSIPQSSSSNTGVITQTDTTEPLDALCSVYSASMYPALSKGNQYPAHEYPEYPAPNNSAWAYWSGTSFATPIITALAARIMEDQLSKDDSVRQAIIKAAVSKTTWTRIPTGDLPGPMIMIKQGWVSENTYKS